MISVHLLMVQNAKAHFGISAVFILIAPSWGRGVLLSPVLRHTGAQAQDF